MQPNQSTTLRWRALGLVLALMFWTPASVLAQLVPGQGNQQEQAAKVKPLPPAQFIPSHDYDTRNITLNLRFDWAQEQAIGTATITLAPLVVNLRSIELDAANMTFNSVKLIAGTSLRYQADAAREKLRVDLDRAYQPTDELTLVIDYRTNGHAKGAGLQGFGKGLTYIKPTEDDPFQRRQIWSQGETEFNHYWFPCYDHPNDFTTTELIATVEKPFTVISNGKLLDVRNNPDGTRTFHWKIEAPHASYLTSIVVGEYTPIEQSYAGIPVVSYVYPDEVEAGRVTVKRMADMVKFFSEKTGVKYPYEKYAQTMTHNFPGGMENISATTQTDSMIHDARAEIDATADSLESHELAHQWFGDFVTTRSWTHGWLNESFATYFQAMWDEQNLGHDDFLYRDVKSNQDQYLRTWRQGNRRPVVTANYEDKDALFDTYFYPRGGAVLHMLRQTLGEENWWRAINHYLTKYAHQPVETEQFRIAVEEATGQSMDWFFDEWLYRMDHPVFRVTKNYDANAKRLTLTVRQEQKIDPTSAYPQVEFFQMPVDVEIGTANNTRVERVRIEPKAEQSFTFTVDGEPQLVNFDYQGTLIKELTFDKPTNELIYQLSRDQDVLGRIWALDQLTNRMRDKATVATDKQQITSALVSALTGDKFWAVRQDTATALSGVDTPDVRAALLVAAKDQDAHVRARALIVLAALKDASLAPTFQGHLDDPSYATVRAAAFGLGASKSPAAYESLIKLLDTPSWHDTVKASALGGLAVLEDKRALDTGLRYAAKGNLTAVRAAALALVGTTGKGDPRSFPLISETLTKAVANSNFQLTAASGTALIALGDERGVAIFEDAAKATDAPQLKGFLLQLESRLKQSLQAPVTKPTP
jgi:aminopeptidase N